MTLPRRGHHANHPGIVLFRRLSRSEEQTGNVASNIFDPARSLCLKVLVMGQAALSILAEREMSPLAALVVPLLDPLSNRFGCVACGRFQLDSAPIHEAFVDTA